MESAQELEQIITQANLNPSPTIKHNNLIKGHEARIFLVANIFHFAKNILKKEYFIKGHNLFLKNWQLVNFFFLKSPNFVTIVYNIKRCLKISTFLNIGRFD